MKESSSDEKAGQDPGGQISPEIAMPMDENYRWNLGIWMEVVPIIEQFILRLRNTNKAGIERVS